ncbi:MAG TPA: hypothetical protein VFK02_14655 [Kofleriaceae bacterium]|nr:hypothetical protein [Kofleriaceae bacterium]
MSVSFGTNGEKIVTFGNGSDVATGLALQPDGKFVLSGFIPTGTRTPDGFADYEALVARFHSDGLLDLGFAGGFVTHNFSGGDAQDRLGRLALDAEGRIVAAGTAFDTNFVPRVILARFWP